jgi:hypothetical protein
MPRNAVKGKYIHALAWYFDETETEATRDLSLMLELGGDNLKALKEIANIYETQKRL